MNQIRDLIMLGMIILAISLFIGHPETWTWDLAGGPHLVSAIVFLTDTKPFSVIILLALALALFMTRLKF